MKDNSIKIWALTHKQLIEKELAHYGYITTICVLENGLIATGSCDTTIKIWKQINESSLELVTTLTKHTRDNNAIILLKTTV
jgi:WD40 repeat protein